MPEEFSQKKSFNRKETAEILGITIRHLRNLEEAGRLVPIYMGKRKAVYPRSRIEAARSANISPDRTAR